jgi:TonB-linked SusC/RagA family outer membrane protein
VAATDAERAAGRAQNSSIKGWTEDERMRMTARLLASAAVVGTAPTVLVAQAATGTITGRVADRGGQPIAAAQVQVVGTSRGTTTAENGTFRIVGVPAGTYQLRVLRIGFQAQTRPVQVAANGTATADFSLSPTAVNLDVVTVTATGAESRAREAGNVISKITVSDSTTPLSAINNFASLVQGRAAGVTIAQSGGSTGSGARVRIRGANSVSLSNEPLLIIDGVRVNNASASNSIAVGGQTPSRLNDLNPNDIESIDILKGPAAAGLYGTAAANGVIQVTTKRGRAGKTQWSAYTEQGSLRDVAAYPANYGTYANPSSPSSSNTFCWLADQADGACTVADSNLVSFNPLEDPRSSPFRTGRRQRYGVNATGGSEVVQFYLAGDIENEDGIYQTNDIQRRNLRTNLNARLLPTLQTTASIGYLSSVGQLPQNDNNNLGMVSNGLLGQARFVDRPNDTRGGYITSARDSLFFLRTNQDVERFTGGLNATYTPISWLSVIGQGGYDVLNRNDNQIFPANIINNNANNRQGSRTRNQTQIFNYTANLSGVAKFDLRPDLQSTTTLGGQYLREDLLQVTGFGAILLPGAASLAGTTSRFAVGETNADNRTIGLLAQQQIAWRDRLFLTGAIRGDRNSAFGTRFGVIYQPSASISYVVSDESFFPKIPGLSQLRLRGSYGQSSLRPGTLDAVQYYTAVGLTTVGGEGGGFTLTNLGNPNLRPERVTEYEGGFDLGLFGGRANLELTYFQKRSKDALISANLPASTGVGNTVFQNLGAVTNRGLEALLNATLVDVRNFKFDAVFNLATLRNNLDDASLPDGSQVPPIIFGLGGNTQQHRQGYPLGGYWQRPITFADENGDNIIGYDEYTAGDTSVYIGNPLPKLTLSFNPSVTLFRNFRVNALLDRQAGWYQYNATKDFHCATGKCPDLYLAGTPLASQARALANINDATVFGYIQRGDFTRLRELSLTATLPQRFTSRLRGIKGANLTVSGRNLALWTKYDGFDPEVNSAGQANFSQSDFLSQPPVRYFVARFDLNF